MGPKLPVALWAGALAAGALAPGLAAAADPAPVRDELAAARAEIEAGAAKDALERLEDLEERLPKAGAVVPAADLATLWYYRGAAEHKRGDKKGRAMDAWRQVLVVDNDYPWDVALMGDDDTHSLFEALRAEVRARGAVDPGIPEAVGAAKLFVDGEQLPPGETVIAGQHLAQIVCPGDQGTFGAWTDFEKPLRWFKLCPDGVDTSVVVAAEATDEWAEFGPVFGTPAGAEAPVGAPTPIEVTPPETPPETPTETASTPTEVTPPPETPTPTPTPDSSIADDGGGGGKAGIFLMASGGALVVGGAVLNFAVVNPAYEDIEAVRDTPKDFTREEADARTERFNAWRAVTLAMLAGGAGLAGTGIFIDASVKPVVGLGHIGVTGRF